MKVLITGVTGFVGSHLAEFLLGMDDVEVHGIERWRSKTDNIEHIKDRLIMHECDIKDSSSVRNIIEDIEPDRIFHLAAQSFVLTSWSAPAETLMTNIMGELNIFEAVRQARINPRIMVAGSSEEYGFVDESELPIRESQPLRPLSPYAVSKVTQDLLGYQYFRSYKLNIVRTRGFNHTGPRRGEVFVCSNFAKQIARMEKGKQKPVLRVGNLEATRDFTDVRDMVRAYWLSLERGKAGETYNICSGKAYSIGETLDMLLDFSTLGKAAVRIEQDQAKMRPSDVPHLLGDNTYFRKTTGWAPKIRFEQTLKDLLDYWRDRT